MLLWVSGGSNTARWADGSPQRNLPARCGRAEDSTIDAVSLPSGLRDDRTSPYFTGPLGDALGGEPEVLGEVLGRSRGPEAGHPQDAAGKSDEALPAEG